MSWKRNKLANLGCLPLTANQQTVAQVSIQACSVLRSTHPASRSCDLLMPSPLANWAPVFNTIFPVPPALTPLLKGLLFPSKGTRGVEGQGKHQCWGQSSWRRWSAVVYPSETPNTSTLWCAPGRRVGVAAALSVNSGPSPCHHKGVNSTRLKKRMNIAIRSFLICMLYMN